MTGLGPVQTLSEVLAPLGSASLIIDGQDNFGSRSGRWFNLGGASRFLERLPPPGIYAISLAETPLYGGGGIRASQAQLRLCGRFKKSVDALVPGNLQDGVLIEPNCELHVWALTRCCYTIENGRFTLDL